MCDYKLAKIERKVLNNNSIVLLPREIFNKFVTDPAYLKVLISDDRNEIKISKSYYYYILSQLKENHLITENTISFKAAIPVIISEKGIEFDNSIMYVDDENKLLIFIDNQSSKYKCSDCPVYTECEYGLKRIARQMGIKLGNLERELPHTLWLSLISKIVGKVVNNIKSVAVPLNA